MDFKTELKMYQDIVNKELEKYIRKNKCIENIGLQQICHTKI